MKKIILIVLSLGFGLSIQARTNPNPNNSFEIAQFNYQELPSLKKIMEVLKMVESKNNPRAKSPHGNYLGILQISRSCIAEVNQHYGTTYTHRDALSVLISEDIFMKIMKRGIEVFTNKHNRVPTEEQLVRMWNGGLYNGYDKPKTKKYYHKYLKQKKKL